MNMNKEIKKIIIASSCIAVAIVFAAVVHLVGGQPLGKIISPMHIPVFICGLILGWKYGLLVGILTPLVSYMFRGIPPILPTGLGMCLELGTYGFISGLISEKVRFSNKSLLNIYLALIIGMLLGKIVYGLYCTIYFPLNSIPWSFKLFITSLFVEPFIGIIIQLYSIPFVVYGIKKSGILDIYN
jgi:thiamine transporter ThiT